MLFVWISIPFVCKGFGTCGTEVMQYFFCVCINNNNNDNYYYY